jgi:hypothetical protein
MAYVEIKDFKSGLDTRRPAIVGDAGTLTKCINGHITRGGDVESAKEFVLYVTLPTGTFGLHSCNNRLYVFGSGVAPVNLPGQVVYQRLQHPSSADMTELLWAENYDGLVYAIAEYSDGSVYHFYNGIRVTDWDTQAGTIADNESVAAYLTDKVDAVTAFIATASGTDIIITASVAGTAFTIAQAVTGTGTLTITQLQANQPAVTEVRATASFTVTGGFALDTNTISVIDAGATHLIADPVAWVLDNDATAASCASKINQRTSIHGFTATSSGATVTIKAPVGTGATANGIVLTVTPDNFVTVGSVSNFSGGVTAVAALPQIEKVAVGGTYAATNTYKITLNGVDYLITGLASGYSRFARSFKDKMYTAARALTIFSAVGDPTTVTTGTGIGSINISSQDQGSQTLTGFGVYQGLLAIFTADTIQIWQMDPDPTLNTFRQLLQNTGTRSPKAIIGYGNSDLLYPSDTGIRSLRARDSANNAAVDDIGTRIDATVIEYLATLTDAQIRNACSVTDPTDGRAWIALGNRIFVFSFFPGSKVSAWSWYEPGFEIDNMAVAGKRIYVRSGESVYAYGGTSGDTYPDRNESTVTIQLPFIDANRIAGNKAITGIDVICQGQWTLELLIDPTDETKTTIPIVIDESTVTKGRIPVNGITTHFAPRLTSTKGGRVTLSSVVVHFDDVETV